MYIKTINNFHVYITALFQPSLSGHIYGWTVYKSYTVYADKTNSQKIQVNII